MFKKQKIKGTKCYGITSDGGSSILCTDKDLECVKSRLDSHFKFLVELTVTRVFTRENDLKEIETEL